MHCWPRPSLYTGPFSPRLRVRPPPFPAPFSSQLPFTVMVVRRLLTTFLSKSSVLSLRFSPLSFFGSSLIFYFLLLLSGLCVGSLKFTVFSIKPQLRRPIPLLLFFLPSLAMHDFFFPEVTFLVNPPASCALPTLVGNS